MKRVKITAYNKSNINQIAVTFLIRVNYFFKRILGFFFIVTELSNCFRFSLLHQVIFSLSEIKNTILQRSEWSWMNKQMSTRLRGTMYNVTIPVTTSHVVKSQLNGNQSGLKELEDQRQGDIIGHSWLGRTIGVYRFKISWCLFLHLIQNDDTLVTTSIQHSTLWLQQKILDKFNGCSCHIKLVISYGSKIAYTPSAP